MKWRRLGMIFNTNEHPLPRGCIGYAQAPQPVVFDSFVRVFFSTRTLDEQNGKPISNITFADFSPDFSEIRYIHDRFVIDKGELGCFDEHGVFPMNVVKHDNRLLGYTCGWSRRTSVSVETGIGLAYSDDDGHHFHRAGKGPILTSSPKEPCLVGDGFVRKNENGFDMWYIFGTGWKMYPSYSSPERVYKIAHASSTDGVNWEKTNEGNPIIPDVIGPDECQALPCVITINSRHHMFFCFRHPTDFRSNPKRSYRIGHASSDDLVTWIRKDDEFILCQAQNENDSEMMCYPGVCKSNDNIYILYNGNEFGKLGFFAAVLES